ncbi:MAG: RluA family pseudouridine synthase [Oceanicaulis sp.]|nr:RluA family pseudouridine synthase [Oceanicaulis sp.]
MSTTEDDIRALSPEPEALGERLDRWLAAQCQDLSRSRCKALIEAGALTVDGAVLDDPSAKLRAGAYVLRVPAPEPAIPLPEALPLDILFEDSHLIVINKAAGMTVHPAAGAWTGTLVHALLHHCAGSLSGIGGVMRPGIVHRLDKDTSGVMVAAKSDEAHQGLSEQFAAHDVERAYIAFTRGAPKPRAGRIETRLGRSDHDRKKIAVLPGHSQAGKHAITNYETQAVYGQTPGASVGTPVAARVECRLETGRTHQIRVHMAHISCPLLGDPLYGKGRGGVLAKLDDGKVFRGFSRQALHAAVLGFIHPVTGERLQFDTPIPSDMARLQGFLETL